MKLTRIYAKNFIGLEEFDYNPSGFLNVFEGPKGSGKSSVLDAIRKTLSNVGVRTELIRHGEEEALLLIETDEGLTVDRRLRKDKSNYLKITKDGEGIKSVERELKKLISGDIFRPLDFIELTIEEQTKIILNMIEMDYSPAEICQWFNEDENGQLLKDINTDKHILQVLKDIESKFYKERTEVKREISTLQLRIRDIEKGLPNNYEGEKWENEVLGDYYDKISKAKDLNSKIDKAKAIIENFEDKIKAIKSDTNSQISDIKIKYQQEKEDIKDLVQVNKDKIGKTNNDIDKLDVSLNQELNDVDSWLEKEIRKLKEQAKKLKEQHKENCNTLKESKREDAQSYKEKIASKKSELNGLDDKQKIEIDNIDKSKEEKIKAEQNKVKNSKLFIADNKNISIEPLEMEAKNVADMQSYLRDWRSRNDIRDGIFAKKTKRHTYLTDIIEIARSKPTDLIQQHKLPISGISVDEEGLIRINDTLLDGLSSGEALEVAFKIALERMGTLRIICIDGFERLNESEQKKVIDLCKNNDVQGFFTKTTDTEDGKYHIKTIDDENGQANLFDN